MFLGCWACAASGQAVAAPPTRVINSRRLMCPLKPRITSYHIVEKKPRLCITAFWPPDFRNGSKCDIAVGPC